MRIPEPARRCRLVLARGLAVVGAALTLLALVIAVAFHRVSSGPIAADVITDYWLMPMIAAVTFAASGALLVWSRPGLSIGWLALTAGATNGLMWACMEYGVWA